MGAMTSSASTTSALIARLRKDYQDFKFQEGKQEHWSPKTNTIIYNPGHSSYGVLHELAHAILKHTDYQADFELLKLESDAWELATKIGKTYEVDIDDDHVQNCLDTYRDWLHKRSSCPSCNTHVLQKNSGNYHCFNCQMDWRVSNGRFVRPYRKIIQ
jgi:hypothetical protein